MVSKTTIMELFCRLELPFYIRSKENFSMRILTKYIFQTSVTSDNLNGLLRFLLKIVFKRLSKTKMVTNF